MKNLEKLQAKKALLQAQIEQQKTELQQTLRDIRDDFEPANLLRNALVRTFSPAPKRAGDAAAASNFSSLVAAPLLLILQFFLGNSRLGGALAQLVSPLFADFFEKISGNIFEKKSAAEDAAAPPPPRRNLKLQFYRWLRRQVSALRELLKNRPTAAPELVQPTEN